jgi:hypothetical protein
MTETTPAHRLGVTGHRVLDDAAAVATLVDQVLDDLGPSGTMISSLAEGADRLAAERALARPGWSLAVVLPLDPLDYGDDFADVASQNEFDDLLGAASEVTQVPDEPSRDAAYLAAGLAVLHASDALLAVWDGEPARGVGGTADIVGRARAEGHPMAWIRVAGPAGPPQAPSLLTERWPWVR